MNIFNRPTAAAPRETRGLGSFGEATLTRDPGDLVKTPPLATYRQQLSPPGGRRNPLHTPLPPTLVLAVLQTCEALVRPARPIRPRSRGQALLRVAPSARRKRCPRMQGCSRHGTTAEAPTRRDLSTPPLPRSNTSQMNPSATSREPEKKSPAERWAWARGRSGAGDT